MDFNDSKIYEICSIFQSVSPRRDHYNRYFKKELDKIGISYSRAVRIMNQLRPECYPYHKESRYVLTRLVRDPDFEQRYREVCRKCLPGDTDDWIDHLKKNIAPLYPSRKKSMVHDQGIYAWSVYSQEKKSDK